MLVTGFLRRTRDIASGQLGATQCGGPRVAHGGNRQHAAAPHPDPSHPPRHGIPSPELNTSSPSVVREPYYPTATAAGDSGAHHHSGVCDREQRQLKRPFLSKTFLVLVPQPGLPFLMENGKVCVPSLTK